MDKAYFEAIDKVEMKMAVRLADILTDMFNPASIIDMGCATGLYLKPFKDNQKRVKGYDIAVVAKEISLVPEDIDIVDLSKPFIPARGDVALCLEVAEHIDEQYAETFINNVCWASDIIIFSAAIEKQGGEEHINCQPKTYWIDMFGKKGYHLDEGLTEELLKRVKDGYHLGWLTQNGMVFVNSAINKCNFILTSDELYYPYYLSIMSAIKTQRTNQFILWAFKEPTGEYWQFIKDRVNLKIIKKLDYPALRNKPLPFQYAHLKDAILWEVLHSCGGLYLDLDNFCVADIFELWEDDKELLVNLNYDQELPPERFPEYLYHAGCMIAKPGLSVMKQISLEATALFLRDDITWGKTGPPLFSRLLHENNSNIKAVERGVLGGNGQKVWNTKDILSPGKLWDKAKLAHLYAGKRHDILQYINKDFIETSPSLYAVLVRDTLSKDEWHPLGNIYDKLVDIKDYGAWPLGVQFRRLLYALVPDDSTILELGSGIATNELAEHYEMVSIEHDSEWLKDIDTHYIYAPLQDGWYDIDSVSKNIKPLNYDALLIDGPVGNSRVGFYEHRHLFDLSGWIFVDDIHRQIDSDMFDKLAEELDNRRAWKFHDQHGKAFGVIAPVDCDDIGAMVQKLDIECYYNGKPEPVSDNIIHFVLTSNELIYPYYLSILSALKTQNADKYILWAFKEPTGNYWPILKDRVELKLVTKQYIKACSEDIQPYIYRASVSNCLEWDALYRYGGIYLDLDTFCIADITKFLKESNKEMVLPNEVKDTDRNYPFFNSSIVMAHCNSGLMKQVVDNTEKLLEKEDLSRGELAFQLVEVARTNLNKIDTIEYGVCGGGGSDRPVDNLAQENGELGEHVKVLHLFANDSPFWDKLSEDFIRNSNILFARTVRDTLTRDEWDPLMTHKSNDKDAPFWIIAQKDERAFWGDCRKANASNEEKKQFKYAKKMGLEILPDKKYDLQGKTILDIGGGPVSLLLKCHNFKRAKVIDPMLMPEWIEERYAENGIEYERIKGEDIQESGWDEVWIYNVLTHTENPQIVAKNAKKAGAVIRVYEWVNTKTNTMHPHTLSKVQLDEWFECNGKEILSDDKRSGQYSVVTDKDSGVPCPNGHEGEPGPPGFIPKYKPSGLIHRHKRFHLPGLPHVATNKNEALACAFSQKVIKMAQMLKSQGHTVFFYGVEGSEVECDEYIQVSTQDILREAYGEYDMKKETYRHKVDSIATKVFNQNAIHEIRKRMQSNDFLLIPFSPAVYKHLIDTLYNKYIDTGDGIYLIVEMGIGYRGTYCPFRVWESVSQMHFQYGLESASDGGSKKNGGNYDVVIPNYFDPDDFTYSEKKDDYFLYLGRVVKRKGIAIAIQTINEIGSRLIVAGQKAGESIEKLLQNPLVEDIGFADHETRRKLLSGAKALILPTMYIEPFGGVIIEAALSGTPVITSDWGAFPELVIHGKTGYRCRTFDHYIWAAKNIDNIKPIDCYQYAMANFTLDRVALMYEEYFNMLLDVKENVDKKGWNRIHPERTNLDWLVRSR